MNNEQFENETKKTVPCTVASNRIIYIGINVMKTVQDLYNENYKAMLKDIKENLNKWKNSLSSHRLENSDFLLFFFLSSHKVCGILTTD